MRMENNLIRLEAFNFYKPTQAATPTPASAKDIEYTGRDMILITPRETFYLDDHDSILAAKKR